VDLGRLAAADVVEDESAATDGSQLRVAPAGIANAMLVELALRGLDVVVDKGDGYAVVLKGVEGKTRLHGYRRIHCPIAHALRRLAERVHSRRPSCIRRRNDVPPTYQVVPVSCTSPVPPERCTQTAD
jgi:hypothetical protein